MSKFLAFFFALAVSTSMMAANAQPEPTLSLDFENGVQGVGRGGQTIAPRVEGKTEFQDGKFGKAFKTGPGGGYLYAPTAGVLRAQEGTVEMWVMPLDWSGAEQHFHAFFDAHGEGVLYLYKFWNSGLLMLSGSQSGGPFKMAGFGIDNWKPGEWHHIAGVWSPTHQVLYVDGKRVGSSASSLPKTLGEEFFLGDAAWPGGSGERTSSSLIDRVRIYDRALSDAHIAAHFAGDYNKIVPLTDETLQLSYSLQSANETAPRVLLARATTQGVDIENGTRLSLAISQNERPILTLPPQDFSSTATGEMPLKTLAPGEYQLTATATRGTAQLARVTQRLIVPKLEWLGNTLGLNAGVLPPWTPLKIKRDKGDTSISCWGRTYQFNGAPLPTQIVSKNQSVLASPIVLDVVANSQKLAWSSGEVKIISQSPARVELQGRAQAQTAQGKIELQTVMALEYDGLMTIATRLHAPAAFAPESVQLQIPIRSPNALYHHRWAEQWKGFSGNVPKEMGVVDASAFIPFAWLGDNERGLFWFCESGQNWPNFAAKNAFETVRAKDAVTLRFNLLGANQTLPPNWSYQFGLQATPVKAVPRDWRKWRFGPAKTANLNIIWPDAPPENKNAFKYFGSPIATHPKLFAERVEKLHHQGIKAVPYSWLSYIASDVPEWKWFEPHWRNGMTDTAGLEYSWGVTWDGTNPQSKTFSDYVIWRNHEFLRDFKVDGFYHDQAHPYPLYSAESNFGWRDAAGQLQPIYPLLAYRDLYRRLYAMTKKENPNAFLMAHMSGKIAIPFLAYEDAILNGENLIEGLKDSYMDVVDLDYWRAELMGKQWGLMPFFLPELRDEHATNEAPTRGLAALTLLHDVSVWPLWSNISVWNEMYDALDEFGYVDSDFIPYFDPDPPATTDMKDVYVSVYKRKDGRALAIVGNTSREARSGTVTLDAKRIGLSVSGVLLWPGRKAATQDGAKIKLDLPGLSYQMLLIGKAPSKK